MRVIFSADIDSGNAAFEDDPVAEVQRIIRSALENLSVNINDTVAVPLRDINGNKVGELALTVLEND
jgi:hypothetical protein